MNAFDMREALPAIALALCMVAVACELPPREVVEPDSRTITLLWTGTIRGALEECDCPLVPGGLPRLATLVAETRAAAPDITVLIDAGDVTGDAEGEEDPEIDPQIARRVRAEIAYDEMASMGYDLYVPGERDLTLGAAPLADRIAAGSGRLLTTNVWSVATASPLGDEVYWVETERGDVALLSAVAPLDETQALAARRGHDAQIDVLDAGAALTLALDSVRERASFVVLFAHGPTDWARALLTLVDGVDVCVVAHDDENPTQVEQVGETFLLKTAGDGKSLGVLEITLRADGSLTYSGFPLAPNGDVAPDPDAQATVDGLAAAMDAAQRDFETANPGEHHPSGSTYVGFTACGECHPSAVEVWQRTAHVGAFHALLDTGFNTEPECFECHATGFGYASGFVSHTASRTLSGVTCEACHGPSSRHTEDEQPYSQPDEGTCRACHTELSDPGFDFDAMYPLIEHHDEARESAPPPSPRRP